MELIATVAPAAGHRTFLYSRLVERLDDLSADIAFLGIPYGNAYDYHAIVNDQANAPAAMRRVSDRLIRSMERYDFDLGGTLYRRTGDRYGGLRRCARGTMATPPDI